MDNENVIRSIIGIIVADDKIDAAEKQFLADTCKKLGVDQNIVDQTLNDIRQGRGKVFLPDQPDDQVQLLESLIKAAVADGEVSSEERDILNLVAGKIGMSLSELDDFINSCLKKAIAASPVNSPDVETMVCPKCHFRQVAGGLECIRCGIIFSKIKAASFSAAGGNGGAAERLGKQDDFETVSGLVVSQKKEWGEILTGFETKNRYIVMAQNGTEMFYAAEASGSLMLRLILKALRPFTIFVTKPGGQSVLHVERPFRFYFHEINVYGHNGLLLGRVKRRFSFLRRIYSVFDANGNQIFQLFGPILHPWTFEILKGDTEIGKITKKWSGLLKEGFTDADNFGILFPENLPTNQKAILLGAVFLIDFVHFENTGNPSFSS